MSVTVTNEQIKKDIVDRFYWDSRIDASDIQVEVDSDGIVTLSGTVPSFRAMRAAEEEAWSVHDDVTSVINKINVEYPETAEIPVDKEITSNIMDALVWNPGIDASDIDVTTNAGIVTLEGPVVSFLKKLRVEEIAYDITGVVDVINKLTVVPTETHNDKDIADRIMSVMSRNIHISVDKVNVKVEDGHVTLTGTVPSWRAYRAAFNAAKLTRGVIGVSNKLEIEEEV